MSLIAGQGADPGGGRGVAATDAKVQLVLIAMVLIGINGREGERPTTGTCLVLGTWRMPLLGSNLRRDAKLFLNLAFVVCLTRGDVSCAMHTKYNDPVHFGVYHYISTELICM